MWVGFNLSCDSRTGRRSRQERRYINLPSGERGAASVERYRAVPRWLNTQLHVEYKSYESTSTNKISDLLDSLL